MVNKRLFPAPPPSWSWLSFLARCCLHLSQELPCLEGRQGGAEAAGEEVWERQRGAAGRCLSAYASGTERGHSPVVHVTKQHARTARPGWEQCAVVFGTILILQLLLGPWPIGAAKSWGLQGKPVPAGPFPTVAACSHGSPLLLADSE